MEGFSGHLYGTININLDEVEEMCEETLVVPAEFLGVCIRLQMILDDVLSTL